MAAKLNDEQRHLIEAPNFGSIATVNSDGSPQVTPVWVDYDGEHVLVNTERSRRKARNIARDPRVAIEVRDRKNPYQAVEIRGRAELVTDGASEHIDRLAKKYMGKDEYPFHEPGEVRVIVRITPEHVAG